MESLIVHNVLSLFPPPKFLNTVKCREGMRKAKWSSLTSNLGTYVSTPHA
jgi:hypothetical protein